MVCAKTLAVFLFLIVSLASTLLPPVSYRQQYAHVPMSRVTEKKSASFTAAKTKSTTRARTTTMLHLDRSKFSTLGIEPDTDFKWYIVQVMATKELYCAKELKETIIDKMGVHDIDGFFVPTRQSGHSHGNRVYAKAAVLYPSYVFCKMKLTKESYTALVNHYRVSSFVGRRIGGRKMGVVIPRELSDEEITQFQLKEKEGEDVDTADVQAFEYEIGEQIVVTEGVYSGETGYVRLVRDGELSCRFYTYGSQVDVKLSASQIRKVTVEEAEQGAFDNQRSTSIGEEDIKRAERAERKEKRRIPGKDDGLTQIFNRAPQERNRRRDRISREGVGGRGEKKGERKVGGVVNKVVDANEERKNWAEFKGKKAATSSGGNSALGNGLMNEEETDSFFNDLLGDLELATKDKEEMQEAQEREGSESPISGDGSDGLDADDDDFFKSLIDDIGRELE